MLRRLFRSRADPPRQSASLGRRLVLILLPVVLIPVILMGAAGYLRTRTILYSQASEQMTTSLLNQIDNISAWARTREIRLAADANRHSLITTSEPITNPDSTRSEFLLAVRATRNYLDELRKDRTTVIFNELLILKAEDGEILVSTDRSMEGEVLSTPILNELSSTTSMTIPTFDHATLSPGTLAIITSVPIGAFQEEEGEILLIGVTSGRRVIDVLSQIETTFSHRGVTQTGSAQASIAIDPSIIVGIQRYTLTLEGQALIDHPIFSGPRDESPQSQEYDNLLGEPVLGAYAWLPEIGMGIVIEAPQAQILAEINSLAPFSAILISSTALLSILVILFVGGRILRPLQKLTEFAQRMSRGDWRYRVPEEREDEIGVLASSLNRMAEDLSGLYRSLEERVEERTLQVRTASEIARAVVSIPTMDELLRNAVELIHERFGYHHVSIFLLDEKGEYAELAESTSETGQALKARGHRIEVGTQSIIGWVTEHNLPRVATSESREPDPLENEFIPETRVELAIPLQVGGSVVGAMDVQSIDPNAFTDEAIEALQGLADQLCAAIQNTRLARTSISAAERAQIISEVTREMGGMMDIDDVLQSAAQALHKALGEPEILIKLHTPEDGGTYPSEELTSQGD